jgi:hypothetical protein
MDVDRIRARLGTSERWKEQRDGWWLEDPDLDVEEMTRVMVETEARLSTITARPASNGESRLIYHWDLDGQLLNVATLTHQRHIPSIAALCPAADWIEREVHDYFAVQFIGREDLEPIVLRPGDSPGLFHWNGKDQGGER